MAIRLLLGAKRFAYKQNPRPFQDHETALDLGFADLPVFVHSDGRRLAATPGDLVQVDAALEGPAVFDGLVPTAEWGAFLEWRQRIAPLLERLIVPVLPVYPEISGDLEDMVFFRQETLRRFGQSVESLANDRYGAYQQMAKVARLGELSAVLARNRFYFWQFTLVDILLVADLQLLRFLDGITIPINLQYYFQRVAQHCQTSLEEGMQPRTDYGETDDL